MTGVPKKISWADNQRMSSQESGSGEELVRHGNGHAVLDSDVESDSNQNVIKCYNGVSNKKNDPNQELVHHISQLQDLVLEMRQSLTAALTQLGTIQGSDAQLSSRIADVDSRLSAQIQGNSDQVIGLKDDLRTMTEKFKDLALTQAEMLVELRDLHQVGIHNNNNGPTRMSDSPPEFRRSKSIDFNIHGHAYATPSERRSNPAQNHRLPTISPEDGYGSDGSECDPVIHRALTICASLKKEFSPPAYGEEYDSDDALSEALSEASKEFIGMTKASESKKTVNHIYARSVCERPQLSPTSKEAVRAKTSQSSDVACQVTENVEAETVDHDPVSEFVEFPSNLVGELAERYEVAMELLRTERNYCNCLWNLQENVYSPLKKAEVINLKDLNTMFPPDLFQIYEQHCILLHKLQDRFNHWDPLETDISDLYERFADPDGSIAKLYFSFVPSFPKITELIRKNLVPNSKAHKLLRRNSRTPNNRPNREKVVDAFEIGNFLIWPVQRIPQYIMIFQRLVKKTPPSHQDRSRLEKVLEGLKSVGERMNSSMQDIMTGVDATSPLPIKPKRKKYGKRLNAPKDANRRCSDPLVTPLSGPEADRNLDLSSQSTASIPTGYDKRNQTAGSVVRSRSSGHSSAAALIRRSSKASAVGALSVAPGVLNFDEDEGDWDSPRFSPPDSGEKGSSSPPDIVTSSSSPAVTRKITPEIQIHQSFLQNSDSPEREESNSDESLTPSTPTRNRGNSESDRESTLLAAETEPSMTKKHERSGSLQSNPPPPAFRQHGERAQSEMDMRDIVLATVQDKAENENQLEAYLLAPSGSSLPPAISEPSLMPHGISDTELSQTMIRLPFMTSTPVDPYGPVPLEFDSDLAVAQQQILRQQPVPEERRVSATLPRDLRFPVRPMATDPWREKINGKRSHSLRKKKISVVKNVNALRNNVAAFFSKKKNARHFNTLCTPMGSQPAITGARPRAFTVGQPDADYAYMGEGTRPNEYGHAQVTPSVTRNKRAVSMQVSADANFSEKPMPEVPRHKHSVPSKSPVPTQGRKFSADNEPSPQIAQDETSNLLV